MFVDKVRVFVKAGDGGNGAVSFRHEKFIDKGGPDGGDGGRGGDVVFVGSNRQNTLSQFRYQKELIAEAGSPGSKRKKHGKSANDLQVFVPVGTVIYSEANIPVGDILSEGQEVVVASGGRGGFGNAHFKSSRRQTPRVAEKGQPGEELEVTLEMKMIAEVGLIGLPNAGKSTLLSKVSNASPEIANYPFTTLRPNLGVVKVSEDRSLLFADIPGLIEGASKGKGLGDDFLRHVERTKVLVHLIDAYSEDIGADYKIIRDELKAYKVDLSKKPEIIVISKIDGQDQAVVEMQKSELTKVLKSKKTPIYEISSLSGKGLKELIYTIDEQVKKYDSQHQVTEEVEDGLLVINLGSKSVDRWEVIKTKQGFVITGQKIERFASQTDFDNFAGVDRIRDIMRKMGIMHELERQSVQANDQIFFGKNSDYGPIEY